MTFPLIPSVPNPCVEFLLHLYRSSSGVGTPNFGELKEAFHFGQKTATKMNSFSNFREPHFRLLQKFAMKYL